MDKSSSSLTTPFAIRPRRIATELSTRPSEAMTISGLGGGGATPSTPSAIRACYR